MDADVKAEFDDIKKLLGDIAKQLGAGANGTPSAPIDPSGAMMIARFGAIKHAIGELNDDDLVVVPRRRAFDGDRRNR
jgi:hypothetical protein